MLRATLILFVLVSSVNRAIAVPEENDVIQNSFSSGQIVISAEVSGQSIDPLDRNFNSKIAIVDIESIYEHSMAIKDIKLKINNLSDKIQNEMSAVELELKEQEADLIRNRHKFSEEEFDKKTSEFNKRVSHAQKLLQSRKVALEQARRDGIANVHSATLSIIGDLSKKHGFNLVLPATQVIFASDKLNITIEVITQLNKSLTSIDLNYDAEE